MGGGGPDQFAAAVEQLRAAWVSEGREGRPRTMALAYSSLGEHAEAHARQYLLNYYAFLGAELSALMADRAAKDPDAIGAYVFAFTAAGCDELIMVPGSSDPRQVELLADAIAPLGDWCFS